MTRVATAPARKSAKRPPAKSPATRARPLVSPEYWTQSQLPLTCLAFLLTPMVIYELGTRFTHREIIAFRLLNDFFNFFGATGPHLPPLAVCCILLTMHIARNDRWAVKPPIVGRMALESLALAIPLIGLSIIFGRYFSHLPLAGSAPSTLAVAHNKVSMIVLSCGAGIYEELVFRLMAFTVLNLLLVDLFQTRKRLSSLLIVAVPAILFSVYHYLGFEQFTLQSFVFRTLAGVYFGIVFLHRGFGITAGSHAAYDIIVVLLAA